MVRNDAAGAKLPSNRAPASDKAGRDRPDAVEHRLNPISLGERELPGERAAHDVIAGADPLAELRHFDASQATELYGCPSTASPLAVATSALLIRTRIVTSRTAAAISLWSIMRP